MFIKRAIMIGVTLLVCLVFNFQPVHAGGYDCAGGYQTAITVIECEALIDLYIYTNGGSWTNNSGWLDTLVEPCDWYGITCTGENVTQINLYNNGLTGTLPSSISDLEYLFNLYLNANDITGNIPASLGMLNNLYQFAAASNQLTGSIPTQLGNMSSLEILSLSGNQLENNIPASLGNLTKLRKLYLHYNQFSGALPSELGNLTKLQELKLNDNQFSGNIPLEFTDLTSLSVFLFDNTFLCELPSSSYQTWKLGVVVYSGTGAVCPVSQEMFYSQSTYDGWVLETGENTNQGGWVNTTNLTCYVGDDSEDKQFRTILHFNTSRLPDSAVVTKASVQYKQQLVVGSDPYATHGMLFVDIKDGFFSGNPALVQSDFGAAPSLGYAGWAKFIPSAMTYPIYRALLKDDALEYVNLDGITQFRLRFGMDDDNDNTADYIKIFCGEMGEPFNRPVLRVWYYVP